MVAGYKPFLESTASSYSQRYKFSPDCEVNEKEEERKRREMEKGEGGEAAARIKKSQYLDFAGLLWKWSELTQQRDNAVVASTDPGWYSTTPTWAATGVMRRPNVVLGPKVWHKWKSDLLDGMRSFDFKMCLGPWWVGTLNNFWSDREVISTRWLAVPKFTLRKCSKAKSCSRTLWLPWLGQILVWWPICHNSKHT